ncbi:MAG TPA: TIGR03557 family F420-dependent LLM class oxidoreductase [Actinomycetota bacterium]
MVQIGYALSSEEHPPSALVENARKAEEAGFPFAFISDHYHPWIDRQGHSPFVWSVIGGIAQVTERLRLATGVTCPTVRTHPAIIAQAAATAACMMPGRFMLGVGSGENLNEHILGMGWPEPEIRLGMLEEAIEVIRLLWEGGSKSHYGEYFMVENARVYDLPEEPPPILMAASGKIAADLAGVVADGFIGTSPDKEIVETFEKSGGSGKPKYGMLHVCWGEDEAQARRTAHEWWPNTSVKGELGQELPLPRHFEQAAEMVSEEDVTSAVMCGPDPQPHLDAIKEYADAGFEYVYVHQVGPDQEGFMRFYQSEILPKFGG